MGTLSRAIFAEIVSSAFLGTVLFTFVLFLQRAGRSFELLVRSSAGGGTIGHLFALMLPFTLTFTLPVGALVGILIGLSRMSSDGEIVGLRAAGVPGRRVMLPVLAFAILALAATAACSLWLTPWSIRETYRILNRIAAEELTAEIQPRVFQEQFPNTILYVGDVIPGPVEKWRKVFLADLREGSERPGGSGEQSSGPPITLAREAIAAPDLANNRIQLHMLDSSTHEAGEQEKYYSTSSPLRDQALQASRSNEVRPARPYPEMDTIPLRREARHSRDAAIELHQRLALPFACVLLALVGVPLGISSRKAGKSTAFVITVFLAFLYYMGFISLISLARQGTVPVGPAVWTPNAVFALVGLVLMLRLERPGDRDIIATLSARLHSLWRRVSRPTPARAAANGRRFGRVPLLPLILDTYILSTFLFYFALLLASFVLMTHVYTFFELLGDIIHNRIPLGRVLAYLFFLTPKLVYDSTPISVLVAVLVTFGVMSKHNEITAFKASGVSLRRLSLPVLLASLCFSAGLFAMDYYRLLPEANRRQEALRDEIKGRAPQTYLRPDRKWIYGQGPRIYYYKYFDPTQAVMIGVSVYELDEKSFRLTRHISAGRASWSAALKTWVFENGWKRDLGVGQEARYQVFQATTFPELDEPPGYFLKEVIQDKQMNFPQLKNYIQELRQSGFDTVHLRVQLQKKLAVPLFAFIMALISVPFAFLTGSRGALAGVGVSLGIAVAYWAVGQVFEQFGNVNQLPAGFAAWSPDAVFALAAMYLMARMRT
jgi:LPS export ABC transporter permease LptG/LPS export ABC transporter permease LptF